MPDDKKTTPTTIEVVRQDKPIIQEESQMVNYDVDSFLEMRKEFITKVNKIMVEGKDYHVIQNKKSLAKGGAEKIASIFGWQAAFQKDTDVIEAFKIEGLIAFICDLSKQGKPVGQGRGAASLGKSGGDANKTIKMAQKSAFIDAVLRASGLSDFFTQDLEDMPREQINQPQNNVYSGKPEYLCSIHDLPLTLIPAGVSKTSKIPYKAFWSCPEKVDGKFCKGPFVNLEHELVRQNPETGLMETFE